MTSPDPSQIVLQVNHKLNSNLFPAKSLAKNLFGYSTPFAPIFKSALHLSFFPPPQ